MVKISSLKAGAPFLKVGSQHLYHVIDSVKTAGGERVRAKNSYNSEIVRFQPDTKVYDKADFKQPELTRQTINVPTKTIYQVNKSGRKPGSTSHGQLAKTDFIKFRTSPEFRQLLADMRQLPEFNTWATSEGEVLQQCFISYIRTRIRNYTPALAKRLEQFG